MRLHVKELEDGMEQLNRNIEIALEHKDRDLEEKDAEIAAANEEIQRLGDQLYNLEDEFDRLKEESERAREDDAAERERLEALVTALREVCYPDLLPFPLKSH